MFNQQDLEQIESHGLTTTQVEKQIENFKKGFDPIAISHAATTGDGIRQFTESEQKEMRVMYDAIKESLSFVKFVPASGAATRMFKDVYEYVDSGKSSAEADKVFAGLKNFAFYDLLKDEKIDTTRKVEALRSIAYRPLGYGALPKGLIPFHKYENETRTAAEEQLVEGALYASSNGKTAVHFTVSPEHKPLFEDLLKGVTAKYEERFGVKYKITYSVQESSTDTIAVDMCNAPFRDSAGKLTFRPAGHGALIENLNHLDADVIFIKTIDNLSHARMAEKTVNSKKTLVAILMMVQRRINSYLIKLEKSVTAALLDEITGFIESELSYKLPACVSSMEQDERTNYITTILERPLRVCGMVRNEGEPGGGPFWVKGKDGSLSLQIVESAQIADADKQLMSDATHFNPVDLVCSVKDRNGKKYDLRKFVDHETGFISVKSKAGVELKAQELPGLWNGGMANWNTIFVEVDIDTFNPVKVLSDLLRTQHQ